MRKKQEFNPFRLDYKEQEYHRLLWLSTIGVSLVGSLLFFPLTLILTANGAGSVWKYLVYYISEIVSAGGLFATLALFTVSVAHEERALRKKVWLWESISLVLISFLLRVVLYWFTAFLDKQLMIGFYFNDKTLEHLTEGGALLSYIASSLLNLPVLFLVLALSLAFVKRSYRKAGVRGVAFPMMKKLPVVVYLLVAVVFAVIETVFTVIDLGFAFSPQVITTTLLPYIEIALFSLLGYYLLSYIVDCFDRK